MSTSVKVYAFADDLKLLSTDTLELQKALTFIQHWTENWQLPIQPAKSEQISFHTQKHNINTQANNLSINGELFNHTDIVKDLGLLIKNDLKWTNYIQNVQLKANSLSYMVMKTFKSRIPHLYINLFKTYIRPIVEYNVSIWSPYLIKDVIKAEYIQKKFTRQICKKLNIKYNNYKDRLKILQLESLEKRRLKFDLTLAYKIINNLIKVNNDFFKVKDFQNKYTLRRNSLYLQKPKIARTLIRQNFFSVRIINCWNKLPSNIVSATNLNLFKKRLDNFPLTTIYDFYYK